MNARYQNGGEGRVRLDLREWVVFLITFGTLVAVICGTFYATISGLSERMAVLEQRQTHGDADDAQRMRLLEKAAAKLDQIALDLADLRARFGRIAAKRPDPKTPDVSLDP